MLIWIAVVAYLKGLNHIEATVGALIEVMHAFSISSSNDNVPLLCKLYTRMLLSDVSVILRNALQKQFLQLTTFKWSII